MDVAEHGEGYDLPKEQVVFVACSTQVRALGAPIAGHAGCASMRASDCRKQVCLLRPTATARTRLA